MRETWSYSGSMVPRHFPHSSSVVGAMEVQNSHHGEAMSKTERVPPLSSWKYPSSGSRIRFFPSPLNSNGGEILTLAPRSIACSVRHPLTSSGMELRFDESRRST